MTQDETIELAKQAGAYRRDIGGSIEFLEVFMLERFTKLVAEKEREECVKLAEDGLIGHTIAKAIRARGQA
jgi:hypothetical protein